MAGAWVALFSGGKDSSYALHSALTTGLDVQRLLTVHPSHESYLYHVPLTELASLAAESIGIPLVEVEPEDLQAPEATDASAQGDAELQPLAGALDELHEELDLAGVIVGAIESRFQADRIERAAADLGIDVFAPLWQRDTRALAEAMLAAGFEIRIVQVAAAGLDESWLGRTLDAAALDELAALREEHGIHLLGEGGEFETLVTDGPHMTHPIEIEAEPEWDGTRGTLRVTDARLRASS
ncbi:MAG: diphthine--ammonia ligase [Salinirussus sp.]